MLPGPATWARPQAFVVPPSRLCVPQRSVAGDDVSDGGVGTSQRDCCGERYIQAVGVRHQ